MVDWDRKPLIEQSNEGLRGDWPRIELGGASKQAYFQLSDRLGGDRRDKTSERMSKMPVGPRTTELCG